MEPQLKCKGCGLPVKLILGSFPRTFVHDATLREVLTMCLQKGLPARHSPVLREREDAVVVGGV